MNIFLPYENDVKKSVQSLDDVRLNKQALETYQLLTNALKERFGDEVKGYKNHPVYVFYKTNPDFLAYYGLACCIEYECRFGKPHQLKDKFRMKAIINDLKHNQPYIPFYMEGSKGQPNHIRTTSNVSALFQAKLCKKWDADKAKGRPPKWTNRQVPEFYKKEMGNGER